MFTIQFDLNTKALETLIEKRRKSTLERLIDSPDKTFTIEVEEEVYNIRYEAYIAGNIELFVQNNVTDDRSLVIPSLRLNIGDILLPESISIDEEPRKEFFSNYEPCKILGSNTLSDNQLQKIYSKIQEIGLLNLIKNL